MPWYMMDARRRPILIDRDKFAPPDDLSVLPLVSFVPGDSVIWMVSER